MQTFGKDSINKFQQDVVIAISLGEASDVDFKASFDPEMAADWVELIKDVVAMANSGGGTIIIGIEDGGQPSGYDCHRLASFEVVSVNWWKSVFVISSRIS
jgi:predicted HTH transcriptional regulator